MVKINVYKQTHANTKTLCFAQTVHVCYSRECFCLAVLAEAICTQVPVVVVHTAVVPAGKGDCSLRKSEELPRHGNHVSQTSLSFLSNTWLDRAPGFQGGHFTTFYIKRFYLLEPGL